jgi:hypothetical protein
MLRLAAPFLLAALLPAQAALPENAPPGMAKIVAAELLEHARFLAGDALGGRLTGTEGQAQAAEFIARHFAALGFEPLGDKPRSGERAFLQEYAIERTAIDPKHTELKVGNLTIEDGWGLLPSAKFDKVAVKGKWVLVDPASPPKLGRAVPVAILRFPELEGGSAELQYSSTLRITQRITAALKNLERAGAKVAVFLLPTDHEGLLARVNTRGLSPGKPLLQRGNAPGERPPGKIPALLFSAALSGKVLAELGLEPRALHSEAPERLAKDSKPADGVLRLAVDVDSKATASNAVAVLRGSDKRLASQAVVFSAHMDHVGRRLDGDVFNGADDNASGSAGLLAIASAFAGNPEPPRRSVIFLSVSGEELGLWGSAHFLDDPPWDRKQIVADVNIDMIGRSGPETEAGQVAVTPSHEHEQFSTMVREAAVLAGQLGLSFTSGDKYFQRSDHYNFAKVGIPVVFFSDGEHEDYHKVSDHADKLDGAKMEKIARLAFWTGWTVANDKSEPKRLGRSDGWAGGAK